MIEMFSLLAHAECWIWKAVFGLKKTLRESFWYYITLVIRFFLMTDECDSTTVRLKFVNADVFLYVTIFWHCIWRSHESLRRNFQCYYCVLARRRDSIEVKFIFRAEWISFDFFYAFDLFLHIHRTFLIYFSASFSLISDSPCRVRIT